MFRREHRIYFSSAFTEGEASKGYFIVNLPFTLDLKGVWKVGIRELFLSSKSISNLAHIYILGDFCENSFVQKGKQLPILKKVYLDKKQKIYSFPDPLYISLKQKEISSFQLEFLDTELKRINFEENFLIECTLHFYKNGG